MTLLTALGLLSNQPANSESSFEFIDQLIAEHAGQSGAYVLERGEEALIARAWLANHAERSIEIQYFIWSTDNIGILAAESVLRAADRGVQVRIIVDDLLIDAPDIHLLALAHHPNIDIRIYNPTNSVGVPIIKKLFNAVTDFRGINQRMHNKTFIVDGKVAITGGRNMAMDYYDYSLEYNFRDRDVFLMGDVVAEMNTSFNDYWNSPLSPRVEDLFGNIASLQKIVNINSKAIDKSYSDLHNYATSPSNFSPQVRAAIESAPAEFPSIAKQVSWGPVEFVSDKPGKNDNKVSLAGGGLTTAALAKLIAEAKHRIVIQSPYLVLSEQAMALFRTAIERGVTVRINTNSLASTDNLPAFGGYRSQRAALLKAGFTIFEYRPDAQTQRETMRQELVGSLETHVTKNPPIFGLHAKTLVVDGETVFIGTYNLDPRSENLNTEVGALIRNKSVAAAVEAAIELDMQPMNSWNAATDDPDQYVDLAKRSKVRLWQLMPIKPIL